MIRVDIVSPLGGNVGGVENVIYGWSRNINGEKVDLRIFHCYQGGAYLKGYDKTYAMDVPFEDVDMAHLIDSYAYFVSNYGAPDICMATNWPIMSKACSVVRDRLSLSDMKIVSWIHSTLSIYEERGFGGIEELLYADAHFTISRETSEAIWSADSAATVYEIGNPVGEAEAGDSEKDPFMLTYVGRLDVYKQIDIILEAMYRAKAPWKLRIIGDGDIRSDVEGWINLLKLNDRVEMLGWQEHPWDMCRDSSILVMASQYEGFPMTAIEASARGKTVISTPVNGITDYIEEGKNGYIFPFDGAAELARILDDIALGARPMCRPEDCKDSVKAFAEGNYYGKIFYALGEIAGDEELRGDKISVIVPCYNREATIRECAESLLKQSMPLYRYELIFVDDASTDSTVDILKTYDRKYPENIMIIEISENSGGCPGNVRNIGMDYATGDYICFVDSDDTVSESMLSDMYQKAHDTGADVVSSGMKLFVEGAEVAENKKEDRVYDLTIPEDLCELLPKEGGSGTACSKLFRKAFLDENAIRFPQDRHVSEDTCFSMKCMLLAKKYVTMSESFYFYRDNEGGTWLKKQDPKWIMECMDTQEELLPLYERRLGKGSEIAMHFICSALDTAKKRLIRQGNEAYYIGETDRMKTVFGEEILERIEKQG